MKKLIAVAAIVMSFGAAAQMPTTIQVEKRLLGSGEQNISVQNAPRFENAQMVGNYGVYHAPKFMPYYPTSATIWPRVVEVKCRGTQCEGYNWLPEMGRGEYLFIRPVQMAVAPTPVPVVIERVIERPVKIPDKKINE
jgi:hypothetical protein